MLNHHQLLLKPAIFIEIHAIFHHNQTIFKILFFLMEIFNDNLDDKKTRLWWKCFVV